MTTTKTMSFTQAIIQFLKKNAEEKFTVPTVVDKMEDAFLSGALNKNILPPKMSQGYKDAKSKQEISNDDRNRFKRGVYIALNTNAGRNGIEKDEEEGMLRYYFTEKAPEEKFEEPDKEAEAEKPSEDEKGLYDILADYLRNLDIGSKRIEESRVKHVIKVQGGNHWLYPDLIGIQHIVKEDWKNDDELALMGNSEKIKLWSFEVKKDINTYNVREKYFQAVANSSWANFGYLVVAEIKGAETSKELSMLANRHGIGVIFLDRENPEGGYIKIPAKEKESIDWVMLRRLTINTDIRDCLTEIHAFCQTTKINKIFWSLEV